MKEPPHKCPNCRRNFVRQWRDFRRLTQEQLAEDAKRALSTINKIENETAGYSPETLCLIAKALKCSIGDLLSVDASKPDDIALWNLLRSISPEQRRQLIRIGEAMMNDWRIVL